MSYGELSIAQRPRLVDVGAGLLAAAGLCSTGRVAYGVLVNLSQDGWSAGGRAMFLVLNAIVLAFSLFLLLLAHQVWRGRLWVWITGLVLLPFTALYGGLLLLITAVGGGVPWAGTGLVVASLAALVVLAAPRTVRDHFLRKPLPMPPPYAGAVPGHSWAPGHPPA